MRTIDEILARVVQVGDCLEWAGHIHSRGYGTVCFKGKSFRAHRFFYEHFLGKVKDGLYVCHKCHNKKCVNPEHLYAGTQKQNMDDMVAANRQAKGDAIAKHKLGELNAASKLTNQQRCQILFCLDSGEKQAHVAKKFRVSDATIFRIKNKREVDCS